MKIVFVTGCLGFIGYHVAQTCLAQGWIVYGIDNLTYAANTDVLNQLENNYNFWFMKDDITKINDIPTCDVVVNTAAETHVDNSILDNNIFINTNVYGVYNLLNLIKKRDAKTFLLQFSTDEVYGDIVEGSHNESSVLKPSNPYSATKAAADMLILAWRRTFGVDSTIVRPTNNYGIHQYHEKLIPRICKAVCENSPFNLHNKGTPQRTWLHVQDTADAVVHIIRNDLRNQIYNISGNYEISNLEIVKNLVKILKNSDDYLPYCDLSKDRVGQDVRYSIDGSLLKSTGWNNQHYFEIELPFIAEYYKRKFTEENIIPYDQSGYTI